MKTFKIKSSAVRAAKKEFGEDWKETATIVEIDGEFGIEMLPAKEAAANQKITKEADVLAFLAQEEAKKEEKAAKKKEIEAKKPLEIPSAPVTIIVAIPSAPTPIPSIPMAPKAPSPAIPAVPELDKVQAVADAMRETHPIGAAILDQAIANEQAEADRLANAQAANVDPLRPRVSVAIKPTKLVWDIADKMPGAKRKDVIEACVKAGIAYGTARTQYQHWFKCINDQKTAPLAVIGADGKITIPAAPK